MTAEHNYRDYLHAIGFRFYQPQTRARGVRHLRAVMNALGLQLDTINTRLPSPHMADARAVTGRHGHHGPVYPAGHADVSRA